MFYINQVSYPLYLYYTYVIFKFRVKTFDWIDLKSVRKLIQKYIM